MKFTNIDKNNNFDFSNTSSDYALYRDIYPKEFYDAFINNGIGLKGTTLLDIGTGTGVIPRNIYKYGAKIIGTDISESQIDEAKKLSKGMDIEYYPKSAEELDFKPKSFDSISICQCIWYLDPKVLVNTLDKLLKDDGKVIITYMAWLPFEDEIARKTEELVLKYNPNWTGCNATRKTPDVPKELLDKFDIVKTDLFDSDIPFTINSWAGRIRACRGTGAALDPNTLEKFNEEHIKMLKENTNGNFTIKHFISYAILMKKKDRN